MPHNLTPGQGSPVPLLKLQMAHRLWLLISSGSKKKEPRYVWVKPWLGTHTNMWAEVSSSAPNLLHKGLLVSPIKWRCHLRELSLVRRPMTTQNCVVLKYKNLVFVVRLGPEISVWGCLWSLLRLHHITKCSLSTRFILLLMFCWQTPQGQLRSYKLLKRNVSCKFVGIFISLYLSMSRDPVQSHYVLGTDIIQCLLAMLHQWRHWFGSLKGFQSHLTIRENTNIFLWPNIRLNFINTGQDGVHLRLENCSMLT